MPCGTSRKEGCLKELPEVRGARLSTERAAPEDERTRKPQVDDGRAQDKGLGSWCPRAFTPALNYPLLGMFYVQEKYTSNQCRPLVFGGFLFSALDLELTDIVCLLSVCPQPLVTYWILLGWSPCNNISPLDSDFAKRSTPDACVC